MQVIRDAMKSADLPYGVIATIGNYDDSFNTEAIDLDALDPIGFSSNVVEPGEILLDGLLTSVLPDPDSIPLGNIFPTMVAQESHVYFGIFDFSKYNDS